MNRDKALEHFKRNDPILYETGKVFIKDLKKLKPIDKNQYFNHLSESIVSQQLSVKASDTIWKRFISLFKEGKPTPKELLKLRDETIREKGLSKQKIEYLKDLSHKIINNEIDLNSIGTLDEQNVIKELIKVKGIGKWTAEMFLIFALARENVFSEGDLGLKNATKKLYKNTPDTNKWSPYKSYASRILWKSLDNE